MLDRRSLALVVAAFLATFGCGGAATTESTEASEASETTITHVSYDGLETLEGDALKSALYGLVRDGRRLGYDRARDILFRNRAFLGPDGKLECNYTGRRVDPDGTRHPGGFNTEHTWPQSLGASQEPARSDLHHLFPVDDRANSARGSFPFGTAECMHNAKRCRYENGGSALGNDDAGAMVFEVRKDKRGNVARAMFYFSIRYKRAIPDIEETTLRTWHLEDPVDDTERARNDAVEALQSNRNPFVDHPEFVERITDF